MDKKVYIVSNMYPNQINLTYGIFVKEQVESLVEMGFDVKLNVISTRENSIFIKIFRYLILFIKALYEGVFGSYKVIHVHFVYPTGVFIPLVRLFSSKKIIATVHGSDAICNGAIKKFFLKRIFKCCDEVVVVGSELKEIVETTYCVDRKKISIIPCGYNPKLFYKLKSSHKKEKISVLFLSRLYKEKGTDTLAEIVEKMHSDSGFQFHIVGDGPEKTHLVDRISKYENVSFYGSVSKQDAASWFQNADLFLFPSQREGFGLVALEALACGIPVVTSNIGGVTDLVEHGKNGYLAEVDNADSFIHFIYQLTNAENLENMKIKATESVSHLTIQNQVRKIIDLYKIN